MRLDKTVLCTLGMDNNLPKKRSFLDLLENITSCLSVSSCNISHKVNVHMSDFSVPLMNALSSLCLVFDSSSSLTFFKMLAISQ